MCVDNRNSGTEKLDLPFRQIHLDFHTSPDIPDVGKDFDAREFGETLERANVDSVTLFARCHHGMLYYDSKLNPERVHPHLANKNLLRMQIDECHRRGIRAPIYTTVQWDHFTADEHPEWLCVDEDGAYMAAPFARATGSFEAGFYRALCVNSPYRDFLKAHVREVLEMFAPVDGLFLDIVFVNPCACKHCRAMMREKGIDAADREERMKFAEETLDAFMLDMTAFIHGITPQCSVFYNRSHVGPSARAALAAFTHFELESLPSGGAWGYMHFPVTQRYARNLGRQCVGMTGKFHTEWGDFHSFKNRAALEYECFRMLALNARCSVGDQLEPCGRLSQPVYDLIGGVYAHVRELESWCRGAEPVADIGVLTPEEFARTGETPLSPAILGAIRMLSEGGRQFDVIDSHSDFSRYKVLVLPDSITFSPSLRSKVSEYLEGGGAVLASFESGMDGAKNSFAFRELPVSLRANPTLDACGELARGREYPAFDYADYILPKGALASGLPETEHVMYIKGVEADALPGAEVLAETMLPYFNRTSEHFCSHRQAPSSGIAGYPAAVKSGCVVWFAHPVFTIYNDYAARWCRALALNALDILLPEPALRHDGPSTLLACLNRQPRESRLVLHLLHYIPERRCARLDVIEDVIPLHNLNVSVRADAKIIAVRLAPEGKTLPCRESAGYVEFTVPEVMGYQVVELEYEPERGEERQ